MVSKPVPDLPVDSSESNMNGVIRELATDKVVNKNVQRVFP